VQTALNPELDAAIFRYPKKSTFTSMRCIGSQQPQRDEFRRSYQVKVLRQEEWFPWP
jgi:hypothetical protein